MCNIRLTGGLGRETITHVLIGLSNPAAELREETEDTMKAKTVSGTISSAFERPITEFNGPDGQPLKPIAYSGETDIYESPAEARAAGDWLNDAKILDAVNAKRVASARAKFITAELEKAGVKEPGLEDPKKALKTIAASLLAQKKADTMEQAEAMAAAILG